MPDVRTITESEIDAYTEAWSVGFHHRPVPGEAEFRRATLDLHRTHAAFDGEDVVGTARSFAAELTVPGGRSVSVGAVTNVTVTATHRRHGLLTEMMRQQLEVMTSLDETAAILIASEAPIYGRFGYGPATEHAQTVVRVPAIRFTSPAPAGTVRLCGAAEGRKEMPGVYERFRRAQPGAIDRSDRWWDVALGLLPRPGPTKADGEEFSALRRDPTGTADGYVRYRIKEHWEDRAAASTMEIDELVAASDEAYAALWRFCTSVDWIQTVRGEDRPPLEPLPWLLEDRRAVRQHRRSDFIWLRLLAVPEALAARTYGGEGRLVIAVDGATVALDAAIDGARCVPTTDAPDLTVELADLGAAYLGGTPLWPAASAGRVTEHRAGALATFDRLFLTSRPPWCNTWF
jgi:predicted acetyltransferase